ncbi:MAG: hypothetical protein JO276_03805 [Sphingomonadaceae bacterium]|nr:hypothetical protein [Sphingomonadaceae bacterium]
MKHASFLLLAGFAAFLLPAAAEARTARCVVQGAGAPIWRGPCDFVPDRGGSFGIQPLRGLFPGGASDISVAVTAPGVADVRGLTRDGVNSRWGEARRSRRDKACWVGQDFSVCVY